MKHLLIMFLIIFSLAFLFFYSMSLNYNPNEEMQTKEYVQNYIKKVEIDDKYVCFILHEFRAISCLIKE